MAAERVSTHHCLLLLRTGGGTMTHTSWLLLAFAADCLRGRTILWEKRRACHFVRKLLGGYLTFKKGFQTFVIWASGVLSSGYFKHACPERKKLPAEMKPMSAHSISERLDSNSEYECWRLCPSWSSLRDQSNLEKEIRTHDFKMPGFLERWLRVKRASYSCRGPKFCFQHPTR